MKNKKDVHTEHCCKIHGCKYGEDKTIELDDGSSHVECSVVSGRKIQSFPCEQCEDVSLKEIK